MNKKSKKMSTPKDDKKPELIVITGGVCSGKTTHRKIKYSNDEYSNIDAGEIFIQLSNGAYYDFPSHLENQMLKIGFDKMRESMKEKKNIVIEIIGSNYESVEELFTWSEKINYSCLVEFIDCDFAESWQRNVNRSDDNISAYYCEPYHIAWFKQAAIEYLKR